MKVIRTVAALVMCAGLASCALDNGNDEPGISGAMGSDIAELSSFFIIRDDDYIAGYEWCGFVVTAGNYSYSWKLNGSTWPTEYPHHSINFLAPAFGSVYLEVFEWDGSVQRNYDAVTLHVVGQHSPPGTSGYTCYNQ